MSSLRLLAFLSFWLFPLSARPVPAARPRVLTLDQALQELEAQNLSLVQAKERAEEARAVVRQSMSALLPTLSASGNYTRNSDQARISIRNIFAQLPIATPSGLPPDTIMQPLESFTASGSLRVPLFVPTAWADLAAATEAATAAKASTEVTRLQLRTALRQAAWTGAAGEEIVAASERAVATALEQVRSAERAVQAGTAVPLAVLQAKTEETQRESDLVGARAELERARLATGVLLGKAEPVQITLSPPVASQPGDGDALVEEALAHRPELAAQAALVRSAERQVDSAWWRLAPQISASGTAFASNVVYPTGDKDGWRATLDLSWTLYDGGFRYGKRRQAAAALDEASAAAEAQRVGVVQDVENATRDLGVAQERMQLGERQRDLAAEAAATARRSFDAGVAGSVDVLDANDRLFRAEVGLADARARLGVAVADLDRAVGRTN